MSQQITISVSDRVAHRAAQVAARGARSVADVLAAWLESAAAQHPVAELSDDEILRLSELRLGDEEQKALGELLERNREGSLTTEERLKLDELMRSYEQGLLRKSQALRVAVERGLREPLAA